jgi:hypothetical protein
MKKQQMRTSDTVNESAIYASSCCGEESAFLKGACFRRCPRCEGLCSWEVVEEYSETAEPLKKQAA